MAIPVWPAELPQRVLRDGFSDTLPDGRESVPSETGPAAMRLRFSSAVRPVQARIAVEPGQIARFERFWREQLKGGALPFIMPDQLADGWPLEDSGGNQLETSAGAPLQIAAKWLVQFAAAPKREQSGRRFVISFSLSILPD